MKTLLFYREHSFLLLSSDDFFSRVKMQELKENSINNKAYVINYLDLCAKFCLNNDNIVIRETGDGGDQEFSWQFFIDKKNKNKVLHDIYNIFSDNHSREYIK